MAKTMGELLVYFVRLKSVYMQVIISQLARKVNSYIEKTSWFSKKFCIKRFKFLFKITYSSAGNGAIFATARFIKENEAARMNM